MVERNMQVAKALVIGTSQSRFLHGHASVLITKPFVDPYFFFFAIKTL
jgi:hypothetical protein